jgi:hypothetical protein
VHLQVFHQSKVFGGSWTCPSQSLVVVLGFDHLARPIQLVEKAVKDVKAKSHSFSDFATNLDDIGKFESMKSPRVEFHFKNIIPIPVCLIKKIITLEDTSPFSLARAFFETMFEINSKLSPAKSNQENIEKDTKKAPDLQEENDKDKSSSCSTENIDGHLSSPSRQLTADSSKFMEMFVHVIQFCYLCSKGKIPPVNYSISSTPEMEKWFKSINHITLLDNKSSTKHVKLPIDNIP